MLAHFLKNSHLLQIEEKGIEQFTGESIGISAISDELWAVFKVDFHIVFKKKAAAFLCYLYISVCGVHHPALCGLACLPRGQGFLGRIYRLETEGISNGCWEELE